MPETTQIDEAYDALVKQAFGTFFQSYTNAMSDPVAEKQADARFRIAILHARHVRDRAKAILP